jgi:hypothetical protein
LHLEIKSTLKIELANRNIGEPHLDQFFPGSSNMVTNVRELACISLYDHSESESGRQFCSSRGENGRTQHQFLGTRNIIKKIVLTMKVLTLECEPRRYVARIGASIG